MRKYTLASLVAVLVLSSALASCGPPPPSPTPKPAAPTPTPKPAAPTPTPEEAKEVARNRTLIYEWASGIGPHQDWDVWNPYALGADHQTGDNLVYEPLAYYTETNDKDHMWLAESYEYSLDYKELTIKTRSGVTWSDGVPFTAEDVAYTFNHLKEAGPKLKHGATIQRLVEEVKATDANTVVFKFKLPAPRFFSYVEYVGDVGIYIVPKHIFEGQDWSSFKHFDLEKGWPVTTSPWKVVDSSPEWKILNRRDDWWAAKAGIRELPKIERVIILARPGFDKASQLLIGNELDLADLLVQDARLVVEKNPAVITWSGRESPYGNVVWWPTVINVDCSKPPYNDPDVRWALSYYIDRQELIDVGYSGDGSMSPGPLPPLPGFEPYEEAIKDLREKYDVLEYNPERATEILIEKGWEKGSDGMWRDNQGNPIRMNIIGSQTFTSLGPVVVEQLRRHGFDASWSSPPDVWDRIYGYDWDICLNGRAGAIKDAYTTLMLFHSATAELPGTHLMNFASWGNEEYDKVVDEYGQTPPDEKDKLLELWYEAMEIWLRELPDITVVDYYWHTAMNTTYWKGWPTAENPYAPPAQFELEYPLVLYGIEPTQ